MLLSLLVKPIVRRSGKQLMVQSNWLVALLTLGAFSRLVHVDGEAKYLYLRVRRFWLFVSTRTIPFRSIERIFYDFGELDLPETPMSSVRLMRLHSSIERYNVAIELKESGERVRLSSFVGSAAGGDLNALLEGHEVYARDGTQGADSRGFVEQLCELTGKSLSAPLTPVPDAQGRHWKCSACKRQVAAKPVCLYCGGRAAPDT